MKEYLIKLVEEKISFEENHKNTLTRTAEVEKQESYISGMRHVLDIIKTPEEYDDGDMVAVSHSDPNVDEKLRNLKFN